MAKLKKIFTAKTMIILSLIIIVFVVSIFFQKPNLEFIDIDNESILTGNYQEDNYNDISSGYQPVENTEITYYADQMTNQIVDGRDYNYDGDVIELVEEKSIDFVVNVETAGAYNIGLYHYDNGTSILPNEISIRIDGEYPYFESEVVELPTYWEFQSVDFREDRYGNEILPTSIKNTEWVFTRLYDKTGLNSSPLLFNLKSGENTITIEGVNGSVLIGYLKIISQRNVPTYTEYIGSNVGEVIGTINTIGAEDIYLKSNPSISLNSERDPSATSYDTKHLRLNSLNGYSFRNGTDELSYQFEVAETGYYNIGFKYKQDYVMQMPVFREIKIDGEIPFKEVSMYPFQYTTEYENLILNDGNDNFKFYFTAGETHTISLRVVLEPYRNAYLNVIGIMDEITDLSLEIKKLTGNKSDQYRNWDLKAYIPDIEDRFDRWINSIDEITNGLQKYTPYDKPGLLTNLLLAKKQLQSLREDVDDIPNKMIMLADGSSSSSQLLGSAVQSFLENGMDIEKMFIGGNGLDTLPKPRANFFVSSWESTKRFFLSFTSNDYAVKDVDEGVLEVWVNHPRQYIEIMQEMIDSENGFTDANGVKVQLSIMPDENKLILANSADIAPDIALGVNNWIPYEFAIRGASLDLRQFEGYENLVTEFSPGVMIPYVFEDGVFGFPETQNFWITFYRTDIFDALNLEVPDTWDEVLEILPELQRYGMNYYEPLAFFKGFKPFVTTIPFIYQFDGTLYSEDGMTTMINSEETLEGMKLMTDLFTVYNMPTEVPNFYNHFRYGTLPIGISDLSTYLQLTIAAPEIAGKWDIALHPGNMNDEGVVERWAASGAQASMILSTTDMPEESWDFLSWWMSSDVQTSFAQRLQTTYGTSYLWNTANLVAFDSLPLPTKHKEVIMSQWEYAIEASRIPGAYMVEREISNSWNSIVFDDSNPRITLDEAAKTANREILYKMEEFNYVLNGRVIKPYIVPTKDNIDYWLKERD